MFRLATLYGRYGARPYTSLNLFFS